MAYTFDQIEQQLNDRGKLNITGSQDAINRGDSSSPGATQGGGGGRVASPTTNPQMPPATDQSRYTGTQRAITAGKQNATVPNAALGDIENNINNTKNTVTNQATDYLNSANSLNNNTVSTADVLSGINGNDQNWSRVLGLLSSSAVPQGDSNYRANIDTNILGKIPSLDTAEGVQQLLGRQVGSNYSPGEAQFDAANLQHNKGYQQAINNLGQQQNALQAYANQTEADTAKTAAATRATQLKDAQTAVRDTLTSQRGSLSAQAQAQADAAELQRKTDSENQDFVDRTAGAAATSARDAFLAKGANPNVPGINENYPGTYLNFSTAPYAANQFYSPDQLGQFNKISSALGLDQAVAGQKPDEYSFDTAGYQTYLGSAADKAQAAQATQAAAAAQAEAQAKIDQQINPPAPPPGPTPDPNNPVVDPNAETPVINYPQPIPDQPPLPYQIQEMKNVGVPLQRAVNGAGDLGQFVLQTGSNIVPQALNAAANFDNTMIQLGQSGIPNAAKTIAGSAANSVKNLRKSFHF